MKYNPNERTLLQSTRCQITETPEREYHVHERTLAGFEIIHTLAETGTIGMTKAQQLCKDIEAAA